MKTKFTILTDPARLFSADAELPEFWRGGDELTFSSAADGELRLFCFRARAEHGSGVCYVQVESDGKTTGTKHFLPVQLTEILVPVFPCSSGRVTVRLTFLTQGTYYLSDVRTALPDAAAVAADPDAVLAGTGEFLAAPETEIRLPDPGAHPAVGPSIAAAISGDWLFSIGRGSFVTADISDRRHPKKVAEVTGLRETRQIALSEDGKYAFVTGRQCGVFVIDVLDPRKPTLAAVYNSVEMATGITVSGHFAFIANRQYGVEAVDISDPCAPRHTAMIRCGEAQSCRVWGQYLFLGLWGERRIDIFDISDLGAAAPVARIALDGKGDDMAVCLSADGKRLLLYAATGQHPAGVEARLAAEDLRYGQGNGMEIFDVTDPHAPVRLSGVKTDGRYYYPANDYWAVRVSHSEDGRTFAFLVNTYNGVFVYDVSDPGEPVRLAHVWLPIPKGSPNFVPHGAGWKSERSLFLPFDGENEIFSPVGDVELAPGVMYVCGVFNDVFALPCPEWCARLPQAPRYPFREGDYYRLPADRYGLFSLRHSAPGGQIFSVVPTGERLILACGSEGITVTDRELRVISRHPTPYAVQHLSLRGDRLFSCETQGGLCEYRVTDGGVKEVRRWSPDGGAVIRMALIGPDCRWALLQADGAVLIALDLGTGQTAQKWRTRGLMYYRNLSPGLVGGRYATVQANGGEHFIFDFAGGMPVPARILSKPHTTMRSNETPFGGGLLSVGKNGFVIYDPARQIADGQFPARDVPLPAGWTGKATVDGSLLMLAERISGRVSFADLSDPAHPVPLCSFVLPGNPDLIASDAEYVYLPAGYQGVFRIDKSELLSRRSAPPEW